MGLNPFRQHFTVFQKQASNVYAILKAPRGDGTESIVLSAPWMTVEGDSNDIGVSYLVAFAQFALKQSHWSKDLIFLFPDYTPSGSFAFLRAYHGLKSEKRTFL